MRKFKFVWWFMNTLHLARGRRFNFTLLGKQIVTGNRLEIIVTKDVKICILVLFTLRELTCTY